MCEQTSLADLRVDIEDYLCNRDKHKPPRLLLDVRRLIFGTDSIEADWFVDYLEHGVWADIIHADGRLAAVIGTHKNVCVCAKVHLVDALAQLSDRSKSIRITATTDQALRWLAAA